MSFEPWKIARGIKNMFAMTWSVPTPTKHMTGSHIARILEKISREEIERKTAMVTSQLARMPRRNIWCQSGVTTFAVAKARTSFW